MKFLKYTFGILIISVTFGFVYVKSQSQKLTPSSQNCVVEGKIVDENNQPASGVNVFSVITDRPPRGRLNHAISSSQGNFILKNVECGSNAIYTEKEEANYASTYSGILATSQAPVINVEEGQPIPVVEIKLGQKSPALVGKVFDARTKKPVNDAQITMCLVDDPKLCYSIVVGADGKFNLLAPLLPFTVKVSSPKHQDWYYGQDGTKNTLTSLTLASENTETINVSLQP